VEEKILRLQRRKRQVIDAALDDDQPMMQGLTSKDLEEVLEL
jgi:SNF2 family DNA or RNA helicase